MGNRRMGRKRLFALNKKGQTTAEPAGLGMSSQVVSNTIIRSGHEVVTEIAVDLASSTSTTVSASTTLNDIIGISGALPAGSDATDQGAAYLTKLTVAQNGYLVGAEMICVEVPTIEGDGTALTDVDLHVHPLATGTFGQVIGDQGTMLIEAGQAWTLGDFKASTTPASTHVSLAATGNIPGEAQYLYLTNGAASAPGQFTAGKYIIRIFGVVEPADANN